MVEELYRRYREELLRFAKNMTQETAMAEDLVQETFYRALKNRKMLEELDERQGRAWLYRTLKNHYRDLLRHQKYETVAEPDGEAGSEAEGYAEVGTEALLASGIGETGLLGPLFRGGSRGFCTHGGTSHKF